MIVPPWVTSFAMQFKMISVVRAGQAFLRGFRAVVEIAAVDVLFPAGS
ncbi:MAG: hypothetical protein KKE83_07455 [Proteobacteria bacterium]|nr:hypothetical protein [Pseudomonadota bacterium]MBU1545588.1 hypothetical protein [Pseudomonadota bacterium]MBU2619506.1 hypothetical protein [Pseudomonadota bacterium]